MTSIHLQQPLLPQLRVELQPIMSFYRLLVLKQRTLIKSCKEVLQGFVHFILITELQQIYFLFYL